MAAGRPSPVPPQIRDALRAELSDLGLDGNAAYRLRRIAEDAYLAGYAEGHLNGGMEAHDDDRNAFDRRAKNPAHAERLRTFIADEAPSWTERVGDTPEAPVVTVSDAATVAARYIAERI